jgi:hypothetical protein
VEISGWIDNQFVGFQFLFAPPNVNPADIALLLLLQERDIRTDDAHWFAVILLTIVEIKALSLLVSFIRTGMLLLVNLGLAEALSCLDSITDDTVFLTRE